jgi:hypothetical protein
VSSEKDIFDPNRQYPNTLLFLENSILGFLQALFGTFPAGHDPKLYHYDNNLTLTEIMIEGQSTDNLTNVDVRPKLVVTRGPVSWNKTHIGNFIGSKNLSMEKRGYASIYNASVGISCFSREDIEADHLAQICFDAVEAFQFKLHRFGFLSINSAQIGQRGIIKKDARPDLSVTPVLLKVQVTKQWKTFVTDPVKLRDVFIQYVVSPS